MGMKRRSNVVRCLFALALVCMAVPSLCYLGLDDHDHLSGFEARAAVPRMDDMSLWHATFQRAAEKWFANKFLFRTTFCRLRYQLYEWANVGAFHETYSRNIISLSDGGLIEKGCAQMDFRRGSAPMTDATHGLVLDRIASLQKRLADHGTDFIFVLAPCKQQLYQAEMPWYMTSLLTRRDGRVQDELIQLLRSRGINYLDAGEFLRRDSSSGDRPVYPYAGAHWNAWGAGRTWNEILRQLNKTGFGGYAINPVVDMKVSSAAEYRDDDIGQLLNLLFPVQVERNVSYKPVFASRRPRVNDGSLLIFGDSYTYQLKLIATESHEFAAGKIVDCDKRKATDEEIRRVSSDLRLVVFVYTVHHQIVLGERFGVVIGNLADRLESVLPKGRFRFSSPSSSVVTLPSGRTMMSGGNRYVELLEGFSTPEDWGVWSVSRWSEIGLVLPQGKGRLCMGLIPFAGLEWIKVFHGNKLLTCWNVKTNPTEAYELDCENLPHGSFVSLRFEASCVTRPADVSDGADQRTLGFGLKYLEWQPQEQDSGIRQ